MSPHEIVSGTKAEAHTHESETAPEWKTTTWLNAPAPLSLAKLRGRVVLVHAFQMLCPGCVARGIPQAQRVAEAFEDTALAVVGLHTVFEHHAAMTETSLRAFLHEYRIHFPVGIDAPSIDANPTPQTMRAYGMRGTPTTLLFDARGRLRRHVFGVHDDLLLGAEIQALLSEAELARASGPRSERDRETGPLASVGSSASVPSTGGDAQPRRRASCDDVACAVAE